MRKWTDEQLINACKNNTTKANVLRELGLSIKSGNYQTIDSYIKRLNINISHFKQDSSINFGDEISLADILIENSKYIYSSNLKKKLLKNKLIENKCNICLLTNWQNKKINLHLDHINGIRDDNRIENLRLLCPNCHSQTETYCRGVRRKKEHKCIECQVKVGKKNTRCISCNGKSKRGKKTKIIWPSINELKQMLLTMSYIDVAKKLGISDNAIRKHLKNN